MVEVESAFFDTFDYKLHPEKIGQGSYGTVYVAENIKDNQKYAAKIMNIESGFDGQEQMRFLRESLILHKLDHPSIVKFIGINFKSFSNPQLLQPTIITEYLPHGSLKNNLNKEKRAIADHDWSSTKKYINLLGISDAMRYLHKQGIAHRDLKPENVLIDSDYYPRVCDFGLSKCFPKSLTKSMKLTITGQFGTPLYLPPEILRGEDSYDQSVDVYAFAMIAYEIVTGIEPFSELGESISPFTLINKIIGGYRPKFTKFVTNKMKNLISRCWSSEIKERPTFEEIFNELSSDSSSFFFESLDETEIDNYMENLSATSNEEKNVVSQDDEMKNKLEKEIKELKNKLSELKNEQNILSKSNFFMDLGLVSLLGDKDKRNIKDSIIKLEKSSEQGNRYSSFILGLIYESGVEVERDMKKSFKYYEIATKQGNPGGFRRIGVCYSNGQKVTKNVSKAAEYYEKSAELGDLIALNNLGLLYEKGEGVEQDFNKAIEYYEKASELDNPFALFNLGNLYEKGKGVEQNYNKAIEYYEKAGELGSSFAFLNLGNLYKKGEGVEQNYNKAIEYYEKAGENDNQGALYNLGLLYEKGEGIEKDCIKAIEYYEKAGKLGNSFAFLNLGNIYKKGEGVEQNYCKAIEYFEKAAEIGNSFALYNLGLLYEKGEGIEKNYIKAIEYYEKAGELNNSFALYILGSLYEKGEGVDQNRDKAIEYYDKAANLGNDFAKKKLESLK